MLRFNQYDQVIHAALAGQGIALGRLELMRPLIEGGQLVIVPTIRSAPPSPNAYWLIFATPDPRNDVRRVAEWICEQAEQTVRMSTHPATT